jgi:hypothetical protein
MTVKIDEKDELNSQKKKDGIAFPQSQGRQKLPLPLK